MPRLSEKKIFDWSLVVAFGLMVLGSLTKNSLLDKLSVVPFAVCAVIGIRWILKPQAQEYFCSLNFDREDDGRVICDFHCMVYGKDKEDAFRRLIDAANHEFGQISKEQVSATGG